MDRRASVIVSLLVAGVLTLVGCTSPAEPTPSPSVTPVVSSPEPSPTPTVNFEEHMLAQIPEEAKGDDLLAAVEMAKFYLLLQPDLYRGGDNSLWQFLALPECQFCSSIVTSTEKRVAEGTLQVGGQYSIPEQVEDAVLDVETDDTTTAFVGFSFTEAAYQIVGTDGSVIKSGGAGTYRAAFALRYTDGLWRVYGASTG